MPWTTTKQKPLFYNLSNSIPRRDIFTGSAITDFFFFYQNMLPLHFEDTVKTLSLYFSLFVRASFFRAVSGLQEKSHKVQSSHRPLLPCSQRLLLLASSVNGCANSFDLLSFLLLSLKFNMSDFHPSCGTYVRFTSLCNTCCPFQHGAGF